MNKVENLQDMVAIVLDIHINLPDMRKCTNLGRKWHDMLVYVQDMLANVEDILLQLADMLVNGRICWLIYSMSS